jgi:hypothetical protein
LIERAALGSLFHVHDEIMHSEIDLRIVIEDDSFVAICSFDTSAFSGPDSTAIQKDRLPAAGNISLRFQSPKGGST